ncbi:MAG: hypothetical protein K2H93_07580, partial [Oscillospiraceae bacterium]|nr:hypothetical protein [Oscillospiraceae bacterium]
MISEKNTKQELLAEYKKLVEQVKAQKKSLSSVKSVNSKSTKADIWAEIQNLQKILVTSETAPKLEKKQPVADTADKGTKEKKEYSLDTVVSTVLKINELINEEKQQQQEIKEENDLSYLNQEIIEEIQALDTAKKMKEQEYQTLCAVEAELKKFAEMINKFKNQHATQEESHVQQEENQKLLIASLTEKVEETNSKKIEDAETALQDTEEKIEADKKKIADERAIEEEKYTYEITRKYLEEDDKWSDETALREEAIQAVKKETTALQAEIDAKAEHVAELTAKIEGIPTLLEKAGQEAAEAKEKEVNKEHGYKKHMAQKDADASIQSLERQIAHVKADYESALAEKNAIQDKLDKAYEESNKLYMQTVQSTGGIK